MIFSNIFSDLKRLFENIKEQMIIRAVNKRALRELEKEIYQQEYEKALREELPKAMRKKAQDDISQRYQRNNRRERRSQSIFDDLNINRRYEDEEF